MTIYDYDDDFAHYECDEANWCKKQTEAEKRTTAYQNLVHKFIH